jgi:hypothetical protein
MQILCQFLPPYDPGFPPDIMSLKDNVWLLMGKGPINFIRRNPLHKLYVCHFFIPESNVCVNVIVKKSYSAVPSVLFLVLILIGLYML